jgi:hypothetical protein
MSRARYATSPIETSTKNPRPDGTPGGDSNNKRLQSQPLRLQVRRWRPSFLFRYFTRRTCDTFPDSALPVRDVRPPLHRHTGLTVLRHGQPNSSRLGMLDDLYDPGLRALSPTASISVLPVALKARMPRLYPDRQAQKKSPPKRGSLGVTTRETLSVFANGRRIQIRRIQISLSRFCLSRFCLSRFCLSRFCLSRFRAVCRAPKNPPRPVD